MSPFKGTLISTYAFFGYEYRIYDDEDIFFVWFKGPTTDWEILKCPESWYETQAGAEHAILIDVDGSQ